MSQLHLKYPEAKPTPITNLCQVKFGGVFFFKNSYIDFGPRGAHPMMLSPMKIRKEDGSVDIHQLAVIELVTGEVIHRHRMAEVVQVDVELLIGEPHGAQ